MSDSAASQATASTREPQHAENLTGDCKAESTMIPAAELQEVEPATPDEEPTSEKTAISTMPTQIQAPASTLKLYLLFPAVCFSTFLFSLNAAVVATVRSNLESSFVFLPTIRNDILLLSRQFPELQTNSTLLVTSDGKEGGPLPNKTIQSDLDILGTEALLR